MMRGLVSKHTKGVLYIHLCLCPIGLNKGVGDLICTISWGHQHDRSSPTNLHCNRNSSPMKFRPYSEKKISFKYKRLFWSCCVTSNLQKMLFYYMLQIGIYKYDIKFQIQLTFKEAKLLFTLKKHSTCPTVTKISYHHSFQKKSAAKHATHFFCCNSSTKKLPKSCRNSFLPCLQVTTKG